MMTLKEIAVEAKLTALNTLRISLKTILKYFRTATTLLFFFNFPSGKIAFCYAIRFEIYCYFSKVVVIVF